MGAREGMRQGSSKLRRQLAGQTEPHICKPMQLVHGHSDRAWIQLEQMRVWSRRQWVKGVHLDAGRGPLNEVSQVVLADVAQALVHLRRVYLSLHSNPLLAAACQPACTKAALPHHQVARVSSR